MEAVLYLRGIYKLIDRLARGRSQSQGLCLSFSVVVVLSFPFVIVLSFAFVCRSNVHGLCALHVVQCLLSGPRLGDSVLLKNEFSNVCKLFVAPA